MELIYSLISILLLLGVLTGIIIVIYVAYKKARSSSSNNGGGGGGGTGIILTVANTETRSTESIDTLKPEMGPDGPLWVNNKFVAPDTDDYTVTVAYTGENTNTLFGLDYAELTVSSGGYHQPDFATDGTTETTATASVPMKKGDTLEFGVKPTGRLDDIKIDVGLLTYVVSK